MRILPSARKHGIDDADIRHAVRHACWSVDLEYDHDERLLIVGPARDGALLEIVCVPAQGPERIIHADRLRPKYYDILR